MTQSKNNPHGIRSGQMVHYMPGPAIISTTVLRVGRKWADCPQMRFSLVTLETDSVFRRARVYLDRDALSESIALERALSRLRMAVQACREPPGVTAAEINAFVDKFEGKGAE